MNAKKILFIILCLASLIGVVIYIILKMSNSNKKKENNENILKRTAKYSSLKSKFKEKRPLSDKEITDYQNKKSNEVLKIASKENNTWKQTKNQSASNVQFLGVGGGFSNTLF